VAGSSAAEALCLEQEPLGRRGQAEAHLGESEDDVRVRLVPRRIVCALLLIVQSLPALQHEALAQQPKVYMRPSLWSLARRSQARA
jgi:hypothetical protein